MKSRRLFHGFAVVDMEMVVEGELMVESVFEIVEVFEFRICPLHFADGVETREEHVEEMVRIGDIFTPEVYLRSEDEMLLFVGQFGWHRLE